MFKKPVFKLFKGSKNHLRPQGPLEKMIVRRDEKGNIPWFHIPLENPTWLPADQDDHMNPHDTVLGFVIGDCAWAIPWWVMKNHHAANLTLKDLHILITMCEACASASAFKRTVSGRILHFEVEGSYNATPVLCDIETHSL